MIIVVDSSVAKSVRGFIYLVRLAHAGDHIVVFCDNPPNSCIVFSSSLHEDMAAIDWKNSVLVTTTQWVQAAT